MSSWSRNTIVRGPQPIKKPHKTNTVAITTCVNFSDKLRLALDLNLLILKKMYVVTDPQDKDTIELCANYKNVEIIICLDAKKNGAKFNKSGLLKKAQVLITPRHRDEWIIIIDADTILPTNFWNETIQKQPVFTNNAIYLMKRKIYQNSEDFAENKPTSIQNGCGFFQLYYNKNKMYADFSDSAGDCDILFQNLFQKQIELLGFCIHLGQNGLDWNGRNSEKWTI
jgi:hypothetical protein